MCGVELPEHCLLTTTLTMQREEQHHSYDDNANLLASSNAFSGSLLVDALIRAN